MSIVFCSIMYKKLKKCIRGAFGMKRVGIYGRVSTDGQKENTSIPEQKEKLLAFCKAKGWVCVDIFIDPGYSGATLERPAMERMIQAVEDGKIDVVLVTKLDRLSRSQKDTLYLIEELFLPNGVDFVSVAESFDTTTSFGRAMVGILSVFAQLERETIKERTFGGRIGRAKKGNWHGGGTDPIGYDYIDGELVINEKEAEQVRMVFEYYAAGLSIAAISERMQGYTTKHGDWRHPGTIATVLDNPLYIGTVHFEGTLTPDSHDPIVSKETFERVSYMRSGVHKYAKKGSKYVLSGLVYCAKCGARYGVKQNSNKKKFYCCHSRSKVNRLMVKDPNCKNKNWILEELENVVYDEISRFNKNPQLFHEIKKIPPKGGIIVGKVQEEITRLNEEIGRLMDLYQANDSTLQVVDVSQRIDSLYQEKMRLLNQINTNQKGNTNTFRMEAAKLLIQELPAAMRKGNIEYVRYSLFQLLERIEVDDSEVYFYWSFAK